MFRFILADTIKAKGRQSQIRHAVRPLHCCRNQNLTTPPPFENEIDFKVCGAQTQPGSHVKWLVWPNILVKKGPSHCWAMEIVAVVQVNLHCVLWTVFHFHFQMNHLPNLDSPATRNWIWKWSHLHAVFPHYPRWQLKVAVTWGILNQEWFIVSAGLLFHS